jgi:hypothetical protein
MDLAMLIIQQFHHITQLPIIILIIKTILPLITL